MGQMYPGARSGWDMPFTPQDAAFGVRVDRVGADGRADNIPLADFHEIETDQNLRALPAPSSAIERAGDELRAIMGELP